MSKTRTAASQKDYRTNYKNSLSASQLPRTRRRRPLTERQTQILDTIYDFTGHNGYPPTLAELAHIIGSTTSTAQGHVDRLIRKGALSRDGEGRRTIRITDKDYLEQNGPIAANFLTDGELIEEFERRGYTANIKSKRSATPAQRARRKP